MREELVNFIYDGLYQYKDNHHNGNFYYLQNPIPQEFSQNSGLYFFFDPNIIVGNDRFKIVRVGITGNNGNNRLGHHQNGTIESSVFRKHLGRALEQLNENFNENEISEYIHLLAYLYIPINENINISELEKTCIKVLSNRNQNEIIYPANENWLGFQIGGDINLAISEAHMWNVQHTNGNDFNNFPFDYYQNILNQLFN
jgi:hypothetical protein